MIVILCWFLFLTTVEGIRNIALGKKTFQSSTSGDAVSSRAVDGNTNPYLAGGSCSSTQVQVSVSWTLLLDRHYKIRRIRIFASRDGPQLSDLYVEVSSDYAKQVKFWYQSEAVPIGGVVDIIKSVPVDGNRVYVDMDHTDDNNTHTNLTLCEVQVYGALEEHFILDEKRGASNEILRQTSRSKLECSAFCLWKDACRSFLWNTSTNECILYADLPTSTARPDDMLGFVPG